MKEKILINLRIIDPSQKMDEIGDIVINEKGKDKKVIVFKYKAKTRYRKKNGHRQNFTDLRVTQITL